MALINCPNCGREISDKAKVCVECGRTIAVENTGIKTVNCPECGEANDGQAGHCTNCGFPFAVVETKKTKNILKKKWFWLLSIIFVLIISILLFEAHSVRTSNYDSDFCTAVLKIVESAADVEKIGNQVRSVWHDAIWEEDNEDTAKYTSTANDFDEALDNLFADEEFVGKITEISEKQKEIDTYLARLKNPPHKYEDIYDKFKELYYSYYDYADFVISCNGSYNSYAEDVQKKSSTLMELYREIKVELLGE